MTRKYTKRFRKSFDDLKISGYCSETLATFFRSIIYKTEVCLQYIISWEYGQDSNTRGVLVKFHKKGSTTYNRLEYFESNIDNDVEDDVTEVEFAFKTTIRPLISGYTTLYFRMNLAKQSVSDKTETCNRKN